MSGTVSSSALRIANVGCPLFLFDDQGAPIRTAAIDLKTPTCDMIIVRRLRSSCEENSATKHAAGHGVWMRPKFDRDLLLFVKK